MLKIFQICFYIKDKDIVVAKKTSYDIGSTVCFYENGQLKISKITGKREDGTYITKMDDSFYNDQSKIKYSDIKGEYLFKLKYLYGIVSSKIILTILLIILIITLIRLNQANKKSKIRKNKKQDFNV